MDYNILPKRAKRCEICKKVIRAWNESGLCTSCHTVEVGKKRRANEK